MAQPKKSIEKKVPVKKKSEKAESLKKSFKGVAENLFGANMLDIPTHYKQEAADAGLECKWVSYRKLKDHNGMDKYGWTGYKFQSRPSYGKIDSDRFLFGSDPEGIVRRGDLILCVRLIEVGNQDRAERQRRRDAQNRHYQTKRKEFKDFIKSESKGAATVDDSED